MVNVSRSVLIDISSVLVCVSFMLFFSETLILISLFPYRSHHIGVTEIKRAKIPLLGLKPPFLETYQ